MNTEESTNSWQRLPPIAMIYFFVRFLRTLISNVFLIIPALLLGYKNIMDNPLVWGPIVLAVIGFTALSIFLTFYFFKYRLANQHIEIRSGVFSKKYVNLPFTRIQNVKLEQPIYYRPFGFTCLALDTAGSAQQEAKIVALKLSFAEALKKEILALHQQEKHNTTQDALSTATKSDITENNDQLFNEQLLNKRSLKDLVIHGITNNRVWIFLGSLAPFMDKIGNIIKDLLNYLGMNTEQLLTFADKSWWQVSLWVFSLTLLVLLPITLFSIAGSIITFYNYTLSKIGDRYIRRSGLLTKHEVTMKLPRLQMIIRKQDWLDLILKRINLTFEQNTAVGEHMQAGALNNKIMVPSITPSECQSLINDVFPENNLENINYAHISKRFLLHYIGYTHTPLLIISSVFFIAVEKLTVFSYLIPLYIVISALIYCRWYRWGYAIDEQFLYVRKGVLGVDYCCFPLYKVQQTQFKQSVFMKKHQLCSLSIVLASGTVNIPYMPQQSGYEITNKLLYQAEESRRSWM